MGLVWLLCAAHRQLSSTLYNTCTQSLRKGKQSLFFSFDFLSFWEDTNFSCRACKASCIFSKLVCNRSSSSHSNNRKEKKKGQCKRAFHHSTEWTYRASLNNAVRKSRFTQTGSRKRETKTAVHTPRGQHKSRSSLSLRGGKKKLPASLRRRQPKNTNWPDTTPSRVTTTTATGNEIREH